MLQAKAQPNARSEEAVSSAENAVCEDMIQILRELVAKEQTNMNIVKLSAINLAKMKDIYPHVKQQSLSILKELIESLQELIKTQFGKTNNTEANQINSNPDACSSSLDIELVILNCRKYNQLMSSVSMAQLATTSKVKDWSMYISTKVYDLLQKPELLEKLTV